MRVRRPEQTRRAILDAARREFAAFGLAGARIDAIADAAGVNKRMLYHYFGGKDELYAAVLAARLEAYVDGRRTDSLVERLARRAANARERTDDLRLLMWEALTERADGVTADAQQRAIWRERVAELDAAQRAGHLVAGLDAAQLELALTALTVFPFAFRRIARLITGAAPGEADFDAAYATFLAAFAGHLTPAPAVVSNAPIAAPAGAPEPNEVRKPRVRLAAATVSRVG